MDIVVNVGMGCVVLYLSLYFFVFILFKVWYNIYGFIKFIIILIICMFNYDLFIYW